MALRPEMRQYARNERLNPALRNYAHYERLPTLSDEIAVFQRENKKSPIKRVKDSIKKLKTEGSVFHRKEKVQPFVRLENTVEAVAKKSVNGFFEGLTYLRTHTPKALKLLQWEKWYFNEYSDKVGDPHKRKTWKDLKEKGVDEMEMYVLYLQAHYSISEKMSNHFASQATSRENMQSWYDFNQDDKENWRFLIEHNWPAAIARGVTNGILSVVPQHPETAPLFLSAGLGVSTLATRLQAQQEEIENHLARQAKELAILLDVHHATHLRSLAQFQDFSGQSVGEIAERIMLGRRLGWESVKVKTDIKATALGVGVAQIAQATTSDSLQSAVMNLLVPAGATALLYGKVRRDNSGKAVTDYIAAQTDFNDAADTVRREELSDQASRISVDLQGTGLQSARKRIVKSLHKSRIKRETPFALFPWLLALTSVELSKHVSSGQYANALQPLVTAGIVLTEVNPYINEFTRQRNAEVARAHVERLWNFLTEIDDSDHHIPSYRERIAFREPTVTTREEAIEKMTGPLVIHAIDIGSRSRTVNVAEPIVLEPGVSFIEAPSGGEGRKSELLRVIASEQGSIAGTHITKGDIDLRDIELGVLRDLVYHVEAVPPASNLTIAEQMVPFIVDDESNLLKETIYEDVFLRGSLNLRYGKDIVDQIYATLPRRKDLIQQWVKEPLGTGEDVEAVIVSEILTHNFAILMDSLFRDNMDSEQTAAFLKRKPGALQGTSTGEAVKIELLKALMKERKVILLDEPAANLEGSAGKPEEFLPTTSLTLLGTFVSKYMQLYPDAVVSIVSNDNRLEQLFRRYFPHTLDKLVYPTSEDHTTTWQAVPFIGDRAELS